jgi:hypothetical protein
MKKVYVTLLILSTLALQFCTSSKKAQVPQAPLVTYVANVAPIVQTNCTPCHFPPGGNKAPLNSYATVKTNIDNIIDRIKKNPTDRGFMPFRHPKLSDSTIHVFEQWKTDGLLEK